jgi:hypothetical protein
VSRVVDRIVRVQERLDDLDKLIVITILGFGGPDKLAGIIGGSPRARAEAIAEWHQARPDTQPTREHLAEMRAGGVKWPRTARRRVPRRRPKVPSKD